MESKDVALLGFITSAQDFVSRHVNDGTDLGELKNVDINRLKNELLGQLKFFDDKEKVESLIDAGSTAFKEYAKEKLNTKTSIEGLGQIFDADFSNYDLVDNEETAEEKINNILDAYDVEEELIAPSNEKKEIDYSYFLSSGNEQDEFGLTADDEFLKTIEANAAKSDEELTTLNAPKKKEKSVVNETPQVKEEKVTSPKVPDAMDEILEEVVNNEKSIKDELESLKASLKSIQEVIKASTIQKVATTGETVKAETDTNLVSTMNAIEKQVTMIEDIISENGEDNASIVDAIQKQVVKEEVKEETKHVTLSETLKEISRANEPEVEQTIVKETYKTPEDIKGPLSTVIKSFGQPEAARMAIIENPGLDVVLKQEEVQEEVEEIEDELNNNYEDINDDLDALDNLSVFVKKKKEYLKEDRSLIEDDEKNRPIYANIKAVYPYLDDEFIKSAYSLKSEFTRNYKEGEKLILLHRAKFEDVEKLREFVEIIMEHEYSVNVDENKMIVDIFRELTNTEGIILSTIFTIANQAKVLYGEYEGYRIIKEEE